MIKPKDFKKANTLMMQIEAHEVALVKYNNIAKELLESQATVKMDLFIENHTKQIESVDLFDEDGFIKSKYGGSGQDKTYSERIGEIKKNIYPSGSPMCEPSEKIVSNEFSPSNGCSVVMDQNEALYVINGVINFIKFNIDALKQQAIKIGLDYEV